MASLITLSVLPQNENQTHQQIQSQLASISIESSTNHNDGNARGASTLTTQPVSAHTRSNRGGSRNPNQPQDRGTNPRGANPIQTGEYESPEKQWQHECTDYQEDNEGDWEGDSSPLTPNPYGPSLDLPTLEDLQQIHDIELQTLQKRTRDQQQEHEHALLQRDTMHKQALLQQKETLLRQ